MVYKWRDGYQPRGVSAQKAGECLEALEQKHSRKLLPQDVVEAARSVNSPLHRAFEWDKSVAANEWNKQQARMMLGALITVRIEQYAPASTAKDVRVYFNVREPKSPRERTYRPVIDVLKDDELKHQVLQKALAEFRSWRDRYQDLKELTEIFEAGNLVIGRLPKKKVA